MALTVRVVVEPMRLEDVGAVHEIERLSFRTPWPAYAFEQELRGNRLARYLVARSEERVVGFAGIWIFSLLDRSKRAHEDRSGFLAQQVRSETGIGAATAAAH